MKRTYLIFLIISLLLLPNYAFSNDIMLIDEDDTQEELIQKNPLKAFNPLTFSGNEAIFKQNSTKITTIDPASTVNLFPGGRGANQLIVYTPKYGVHTGTNEFGTEAIVEDNVVTSISGADSVIPQNGIVISGHGVAKNWITQNISVGSKVYVNEETKTLTVYTTSESYTYEAKVKIAEAQSMMNFYQTRFAGYNSNLPNSYIQTAQNYLTIAQNENQNGAILKQYAQEAIDAANMAIKTSLPYIKNELKGTWIRPVETSREQIIATLDKIKADGFNSIFLETYFHGKTIFPSSVMNKYGFTVQNEIFSGFDPLEAWITEAHKRGIKVHIWFQTFYVGNKAPSTEPSSILAIRPDWGNKLKKDANSQTYSKSVSEHNGYFIDPANPEVQEFLLELLDEIILTYKPDGINLDYIRYPSAKTNNVMNSWGFSAYAREEFKQLYGADPVDLTTADAQWYDWNLYRRQKVTDFVQKAGELCRKRHTYISTVIFPDIASALSTKQQDWTSWSTNDYVDGFTPLFLTYDPKMLASMMYDVARVKSYKTDLYAGVFVTFMGGAPEDLVRQIYQARLMNASGVILFDYAHTTPVYTSTLMAGAFNENVSNNNNYIASQQSKKKRWWKKTKK